MPLALPASVSGRKSVAKMAGEFCREAAVLVVVFYPLEELISTRSPGVWYFGVVVGISFVVWATGVALETWRKS